jgi:hypothetical protein
MARIAGLRVAAFTATAIAGQRYGSVTATWQIGVRQRRYATSQPPSTGRQVPVVNADSSLAK